MVTTDNNVKVAVIMKNQKRKRKVAPLKTVEALDTNEPKHTKYVQNTESSKAMKKSKPAEENQYPILNDEQLVQKFRSVSMTNNQKGRIRQLLRDSLKGTSESLLPEVIHNRIQAILKSSDNHTDSDLRKLRILYNMLKTSLQSDNSKIKKTTEKDETKKVLKKQKKLKEDITLEMKKEMEPHLEEKEGTKDHNKKEIVTKVKGPKRYVVFVGNLPLDINKEKIIQHFSELKDSIKDVRLPKQSEGKKSAIAYVELENEITYELALSKHHSMLGNKRINVLYTAQQNGKISKTEAKSKTAKLVALQKSGKLIGSVPVNKKRSHRRMKMKQAQAKLAAESA